MITTYEGKHNHDVPAARNGTAAAAGTSDHHRMRSMSGNNMQQHMSFGNNNNTGQSPVLLRLKEEKITI